VARTAGRKTKTLFWWCHIRFYPKWGNKVEDGTGRIWASTWRNGRTGRQTLVRSNTGLGYAPSCNAGNAPLFFLVASWWRVGRRRVLDLNLRGCSWPFFVGMTSWKRMSLTLGGRGLHAFVVECPGWRRERGCPRLCCAWAWPRRNGFLGERVSLLGLLEDGSSSKDTSAVWDRFARNEPLNTVEGSAGLSHSHGGDHVLRDRPIHGSPRLFTRTCFSYPYLPVTCHTGNAPPTLRVRWV